MATYALGPPSGRVILKYGIIHAIVVPDRALANQKKGAASLH